VRRRIKLWSLADRFSRAPTLHPTPFPLRGSFAVVKEGLHKESAQRVAIKIVDKKDAVFDAESLEQEVRLPSTATLKTPNTERGCTPSIDPAGMLEPLPPSAWPSHVPFPAALFP
jgi:hypothetical protein